MRMLLRILDDPECIGVFLVVEEPSRLSDLRDNPFFDIRMPD